MSLPPVKKDDMSVANYYPKLDKQLTIPFKQAKKEFEFYYCTHLLYLTSGNVSKAARLAGKDRKDFYYLMKRAGVDHTRYKKRNNN